MDETKLDGEAMKRLAKALAFICGPEHVATVAVRTAGETGLEPDIRKARVAFMRIKPGDRRAALTMMAG